MSSSEMFNLFFNPEFIFVVIRVGIPLMFAAMSAYIAALAGVPNIAVEGIMIMASLFGVYFSALFQSAWLGLACALGIGIFMALVIAFFTIKMKANPIMIGIALNLFAADFSVYLLLVWTGSKGTTASLASKVLPTITLPFIKDIPILGQILSGHYFLTYVCIVLAILMAILVYKTPLGLQMRACGLDEHTAESVGVKVNRTRLIALILSGIMAACAGAYLSMGYLSFFSNGMTAGRGWIGIAAQAVGGANFLIVTLTTVVFSIAQGVVNQLVLTSLPAELVNTIPYICVLLGLIGLSINQYRKARKK